MAQVEHVFEVPYSVEEQHFSLKHHDTVGPFVDILLSVYTTCKWQEVGSHINLEAAHSHVFGDNSSAQEPCDWCNTTFIRRRDYQKEFFD